MAGVVMRKKIKPSRSRGLAVYDKNGRQIINATPMTRPEYPNAPG